MESSSFTINLATDHAGLELKNAVREWLQGEGFTVIDHGAHHVDPQDDFPDFIKKAAQAVSRASATNRAIIFGGSGQGEAMVANRFPHVRATVYYGGPKEIIELSREHNDANILSIGARFVDEALAKQMIWDWLQAPAGTDPRFDRRNQKIERLINEL